MLWESRPVGSFHGDPCLVLDDLGDRLHIAYLGKDGRRARELGFWQVDRGVYELLTPREEVTGLNEEKVEKNLPRRGPANGAQPLPSYPYGSPQWPPAPPPPVATRTRARGTAGRATSASLPWPRPGPGTATALRPIPGAGTATDQPRRDGRLECPRLPRRHRGLESRRHPGQPRRLEPRRLPRRHRGLEWQRPLADTGGWNRDGSPADTGGWSAGGGPGNGSTGTNGHGMASWNGMACLDGMLAAPAPPAPGRRRQVPATGPAVRPQTADSHPGDLLGAGRPGCDPEVGLRAGAGVRRRDVPAADRAKGSRSSARPMAPGTRCALSMTRKRRTSTCSACWPPKPCATAR